MREIGVVGAGAAAAALTYVVDRTVDARVTVLEKSGGVCGRAATYRHDGVVYDYGANYLKDDDDRVVELVTERLSTDGLVEAEGPIWTFDADGDVSEGRDADDHKWTYRSGLTQLAKRLFARTEATVHRRTRVVEIDRDSGREGWTLVDADGERWGPFDDVVLNPPAPQTADLLAASDWGGDGADPHRVDLAGAAREVDYRSVWTAVLGYGFALDRPYYALVNVDKDHAVGWIGREECKPGHVPAGQSVLVVQANHDWSVEHYDRDPTENVADLAGATADLIDDDRLRDPAWTDHQGWRYALPESGAPPGPLREAESAGLYCVGDWVAGEARLHAAVRNGLETGERLALSG